MNEIVRQIFIDKNIKSYDSFFENDWSIKVLNLAKDNKLLENLLLDLVLDWRGASYTTYLPLQTIEHVRSFYEVFFKSDKPNYDLLRLSEIIVKRLRNKIPDLNFDPEITRKIQEEIIIIGSDVNDAFKKSEIAFPLEKTWDEYLEYFSHKLSLWSTQRICYVAIFNSYENFITQSIRIGLNQESYQLCKDSNKHIKDIFGEHILSKCWSNNAIYIIKQIRHCLSHGAGKISDNLKSQRHDLNLIDDIIQITPTDTKNAYNILKNAVEIFTQNGRQYSFFKSNT